MSLKDKVNEEIKTAMRAKNQAALRGLRAIKSAILLAETAEGREAGSPLSPEEEMNLLIKQAKQRRDSIETYEKNGREDLATGEKEELEVIEGFLPKQLSTEEIEANVKAIIEQVGASSMKDMGKVMGMANKQMKGVADGKTISGIVKSLLSS